MNRLFPAAFLAAALCAPTAAFAQWTAEVQPTDVFGNRKVVASIENDEEDLLVVECDQQHDLELADLAPATPQDLDALSQDGSSSATILIKADDGPLMTFQGVREAWNSRYGAYAVSSRTYPLVQAIEAIGGAHNDIEIGVELSGTQDSESFCVDGSTAAIATVAKDCNLDAIKPEAPASPGN